MKFRTIDPLQCLPYEAWVRSIQYYACEQPEGPLPLLAVSSHWETNLFATAEIWTTIYLDGGHDERCRAECFFQLSKGLGVELVMGRNSAVVDLALKYNNRVKSLVFRAKWPETYFSHDVYRFSHKLSNGRYPNLAHIYVEPLCEEVVMIPLSLIKVCTALIGIHGAYIDQDIISSLPPSTIISSVVWNGLELGGQLEVLRVRHSRSRRTVPWLRGYFSIPNIRLRIFELTMEENTGFEMLRFAGDQEHPFPGDSPYLRLLQEFLSTTHYSLQVLTLTMPWDGFARLISFVSICKGLRELTLALDFSTRNPDPWDSSAITVAQMGHIRKFSLSGVSMDLFGHNRQSIIQLLAKGGALKFLEELRLDLGAVEGSRILGLLRTTRGLKELHLAGFEVSTLVGKVSTPIGEVILRYLHTLVLKGQIPLEYLRTPMLACLTCGIGTRNRRLASEAFLGDRAELIVAPIPSLYEWSDSKLFSMPKGAKATPFARLRLLRLLPGVFYMQPKHPLNFSNLRSISFEDDPFYRELPPKPSINHFMLDMLFSPDNCPCLHTISSTKYINWALATAMLHRRNSLKTVTPITSLRLPGFPHRKILMTVADALRPVEGDLHHSILAAAWFDQHIKRRFDTYFFRIRACQDCIMSGYIECSPSHQRVYPVNPPSDHNITALLDLEPPKAYTVQYSAFNLQYWTSHLRETEVTQFKTLIGCSRHKKLNMVHIGADSLVGVTF